MAKYRFEFQMCQEDGTCMFESEAEVSITKKQFQEMEKFIQEHGYSPEFQDIPADIYDKCKYKAFEKSFKVCPPNMELEEGCYVELEPYIPDVFLEQLSAETRQKVQENKPIDLDTLSEEAMDQPVEEPLEEQEPPVPTKENTLYLTIKQLYFDQIVAGTKKQEYREIKPSTYRRYLECDEQGNPYYDLSLVDENDPLCGDIYMWNNGVYPLIPKDAHLFLNLAVGYNKERDTALVEIEDITFEPGTDKEGKPLRFNVDEADQVILCDDGQMCVWQIVYHIGKILEVHRH